ncbi:MAG: serine hydrolase domain-containing protein, partial [Clostridia bacterium]|nr:serine hydrolase domain-containing protein [Clostridia bacterium]
MDFQNLKAFMDDMAKNHTVGNDCEVYLDGKSVFRYFSGCSDWENKTPLNGNELYNIYSCSKVATVTAGLQLYERGKFLLSDPLCEYMPEFRTMYIKNSDGEVSEAKNPITVRDVFTMSAGFSYDFESG